MKDVVDLAPGQRALRAIHARTQVLHRSALRIGLLLMLLAAASSSLFSQQFATLNLTIVDPAGSVIAQANVSVRNVDTGVVRTGVSDKLGSAVISGLSAGEYK